MDKGSYVEMWANKGEENGSDMSECGGSRRRKKKEGKLISVPKNVDARMMVVGITLVSGTDRTARRTGFAG